MLLTWQAFVLQDHVKDLPITEQKRQFLAQQLEYDNMMRQRQMILENANTNSNSNASGAGGGGGEFMGDLMITFFCIDVYGDGWTGSGGSQGTVNLIHPTKGINGVGFDNSNGTKPPWQTLANFPTGTSTGGTIPGYSGSPSHVVYPVTIIEKNIPYPKQQYGIQVITQNAYTVENRLIVSAGWSPYPYENQLPTTKPVIGAGLTGVQPYVENVLPSSMQTNTTYNWNYTIPKYEGGSSGTSDYTGNQAWIRNVVYI